MPSLMDMTAPKIAAQIQLMLISEQNDLFRKALTNSHTLNGLPLSKDGVQGQILITSGVNGEGADYISNAVQAVSEFETFTQDDDPYGAHDFGMFEINGEKLFWKIDLYDESYENGSYDPSNLAVTRRVLTIMLASEY